MCNTCDDNRFQLIEKYKAEIVAATNIAGCKEEMDVLDNILFRFWQMGWLDKLEKPVPQWIPCSERLPEEYVSVLCYQPILYGNNIWIGHLNFDGIWVDSDGWEKLTNPVTAWMPLPEPYKGEEE